MLTRPPKTPANGGSRKARENAILIAYVNASGPKEVEGEAEEGGLARTLTDAHPDTRDLHHRDVVTLQTETIEVLPRVVIQTAMFLEEEADGLMIVAGVI